MSALCGIYFRFDLKKCGPKATSTTALAVPAIRNGDISNSKCFWILNTEKMRVIYLQIIFNVSVGALCALE